MSGRGGTVGIDIGGTKIAVAAVDGSGEVVCEATIATESARGLAAGISRINDTVNGLLAESGWSAGELRGIGIGCAGPVDPARGTILNPHTLPGWEGGDIVTPFRDAFGCPAFSRFRARGPLRSLATVHGLSSLSWPTSVGPRKFLAAGGSCRRGRRFPARHQSHSATRRGRPDQRTPRPRSCLARTRREHAARPPRSG